MADHWTDEDARWSYTLPSGSFLDVDSETLFYTAHLSSGVMLPDWLKLDAARQTFSGTPPADFNGGLD